MIRLEHIRKAFNGKPVLADVSLALAAGETWILRGPSGCGKTTLLEIIAGTLRPDGGRREVQTRRIGYVFQDDVLVPWLSLRKNLELALSRYFPARDRVRRAEDWLSRFELADAGEKKPAEISGGMRRRLNLARAFAIVPDVLLLDEPFAFLEDSWAHTLARLLADVQARHPAAIVLITHDPAPLSFPGVHRLALESAAPGLAFSSHPFAD